MLKIDSTSGELIQIKFEIKPIKQKNIKIYKKKKGLYRPHNVCL
jgi:hypothetical protein